MAASDSAVHALHGMHLEFSLPQIKLFVSETLMPTVGVDIVEYHTMRLSRDTGSHRLCVAMCICSSNLEGM